MLFCSVVFLFLFLPAFLFLYFFLPRRFQNAVLLIFSLLFYAWGSPKHLPLILFSAALNWWGGYLLAKSRRKRRVLRIFVASNVFLLAVFKYVSPISLFLYEAGILSFGLRLALPIGISFYTFQGISYLCDVAKGEVVAERNFVTFSCYLTMFPQLIAGPIVKYSDVSREMQNRKPQFYSGTVRFISGLSMKVLLADPAGLLQEQLMRVGNTSLSMLLGLLFYTFQIFFDFAGYSSMAIGLGRMVGFSFPENFNYPYLAKSVSEFWRRWHITLGGFFREYVYYPLGGSRRGYQKTVRNLFIVWLLTGIWHGAALSFAFWGLWYFLCLWLEKSSLGKRLRNLLPTIFLRFFTIFAITFGWLIFSADSLYVFSERVMSLLGKYGHIGEDTLFDFLRTLPFLILCCLFATPLPKRLFDRFQKYRPIVSLVTLFFLFFLCIAYIIGESYSPFLYFRF